MRYNELSQTSKDLLKENEIAWNENKSIYATKLHKDFYLKAEELKSNEVLGEFIELTSFLKLHQEYGVSTDWATSELNWYVYMNNKKQLEKMFPSTIESLLRFYDDSSLIQFYKEQGAKAPTIIDLVGTTGAGKTTFCQQFINDESKELLKLTITDASESTVIQTDILILDKTDKKLFLKVRKKADIMRDIITVALEIDLRADGQCICDSIKKTTELVDKDTIDKVNNFYVTELQYDAFLKFAKTIQNMFTESQEKDKYKWVIENSVNEELEYILDNVIDEEFDTTYFYGYRQEYDLEDNAEYDIITTIANTEFKYRKEDGEKEYEDAISYRLLFEHAILVLPCSPQAKENLDYDFKQGMVLRDSQGHKLDEQNGIASDFEVKNKIFLIPVDTGGYLIDDRYSNIFEKILISEPKNSVFVLTKIDTNTAYKHYKKSEYKDDKKFKREFSDKIAKTNNKLLTNFNNRLKDKDDNSQMYRDEKLLFKNFMLSFSNAYLSEIDDTTYDSEAHKITYSGNVLEEMDKFNLSIDYLESWFDIVGDVLKQNKLTYHNNLTRIKDVERNVEATAIQKCTKSMKILIDYFISTQKWQNDLDEQLALFREDYRSIYQSGSVWYYSNFLRDGNSTATSSYFKDLTAKLVREINSYITKDSRENFINSQIVEPLTNYLESIYNSKVGNSTSILATIANKIVGNSLERAAKISYKVYDRKAKDYYFMANIRKIYLEKEYIKPQKVSFSSIQVMKRSYGTYTEDYAGIYSILMAKYKYNLETHFMDIFKLAIEAELDKLNKKVK